MTYRTVQRLADTATPEDLFPGQWKIRRNRLDDFKPYLNERWADDCTNAWTLWEEIKTSGYRGGYGAVRSYIRPFRTIATAPAVRPLSPRTVARWILVHSDTLPENARLELKSVFTYCPGSDALTGHVRAFGRMIAELRGDRLPQWIEAVRADDLPSLHTFVDGLERDLAAVTAGLPLPWSSRGVGGHINRIKMLKRQMYGRAGFAAPAEASSPRVLSPSRLATTASAVESLQHGGKILLRCLARQGTDLRLQCRRFWDSSWGAVAERDVVVRSRGAGCSSGPRMRFIEYSGDR
ncbi:hypothetical protein [Streptomyces sp. NPDC014734]|uniref:hypothetical protein n=1 Tax=Streptomyces sp. NPDC014734 TaxID=3364886 RepID=UPI0036F50B4A